jgi:hypothetical protein
VADATRHNQERIGDALSVSTRKVETPVYDGSSGEQTDTHVTYELGDTIDGTFVPFASVRESFVKHTQDLDARAKEKAKAEKKSGNDSSSSSDEQ